MRNTGILLVVFAACFLSMATMDQGNGSIDNASLSVGDFFNNPDEIVILMKSGKGSEKSEVYRTSDQSEMKKISGYISSKGTPLYKCGHHGVINFIKGGETLDVEFNYSDGCAHVLYFKGSKLVSKALTKDGMKFLQRLNQ